jgi:hypothetical protein
MDTLTMQKISEIDYMRMCAILNNSGDCHGLYGFERIHSISRAAHILHFHTYNLQDLQQHLDIQFAST